MAKNPFLKRAHEQHEYTSEQILELKKCSEDPIYFILTYCMIQHPVKGAVPFALYDYQKKLIDSFQNNISNIVLSARQTGKALSIFTDIPTPQGWVAMDDIRVGDTVLGPDGNPTVVTFVTDTMYNHDCYKVNFSNGESIIADGDHLWGVNDTFIGRFVVKTTKQLLTGGNGPRPDGKTCRYSTDVALALELPDQDLPIDPYILGTWLGDGTSSRGEFTTHKDDLELYNYHKSLLLSYRIRPVKDHPHILQVCCKELNPLLKQLNLTNNKHIPPKYLRASKDQRLKLLRGLMDTDGTIGKKGECELTLTNNILAADAYELICSLGIKSTIAKRTKGRFETNSILFTPYTQDIEVFKLKRKKEKQKNAPHATRKLSTKRRSILSIVPVPSVPVKCITVDNQSHMFLAGRAMVPTHNSTTSSAYLMWFAMFQDEKTVLIASNKNDTAMLMITQCKFIYERLPHWLKPGLSDDYSKHSIGFDNGSKIVSCATSEQSGRGMAISLLFLDEFAHVRENVADAFWTSISPTLATGGALIICSTPNGDTNLFAELWRGAVLGVNGFAPNEVKWDEPPGRDDKFREAQIAKIGELRWRQEFLCEFLSNDPLLINTVTLATLTKMVKNVKPIGTIGEILFYKQPQAGTTYLVGMDVATGTGKDFTTMEVFEFPSLEHVAEWRSNTTSSAVAYPILTKLLRVLERTGSTVYFSVENNGVGEGIIALYESDENPPTNSEFISEDGQARSGMTTTGKTKMKACMTFKELVEKGTIQINSPLLVEELKAFVRRGTTWDHKPGATSDLVMATLIVMRILEGIASYDQEAYDLLTAGAYNSTLGEDGEWDENDTPMDMII